MKNVMPTVATVFAAALAISTCVPSAVADKPVLLVTIASLDEMLADIAYLTETVGMAQAGEMAAGMATQFAQGLDGTRPLGVVVQSKGDELRTLGMVPVTDLQKLLAALEPQLGRPQEAGDGILELSGGVPIFVKAQGPWAFVAQNPSDLANLPDDPAPLLEGLTSSYDVAIRAYVQNVPQSYRDMAMSQLTESARLQLENLPQGGDAELQRQLMENSIAQWRSFLEGLDQFTLGWKVDMEGKKVQLDSSVVAVPDTKLARQVAALNDLTSRFSGFVMKEAAITINSTSRLLTEDVASTVAMLGPAQTEWEKWLEQSEEVADPNLKSALKSIADSLFAVARETIQAGILDAGFSSVATGDALSFIAGFHVADGGAVETALQQVAALLAQEPTAPQLQLNADQHAGVKFHSMALPVPAGDAQRVFGDELPVAVGVAQESVYLAVGNQAMPLLRRAIDGSTSAAGAPSLPFRMRIALAPIVQFARAMSDNDALAAVSAAFSEGADDQILAVSKPIANGATYRLEIREGVLRAAGEGILAAQGAALGN